MQALPEEVFSQEVEDFVGVVGWENALISQDAMTSDSLFGVQSVEWHFPEAWEGLRGASAVETPVGQPERKNEKKTYE